MATDPNPNLSNPFFNKDDDKRHEPITPEEYFRRLGVQAIVEAVRAVPKLEARILALEAEVAALKATVQYQGNGLQTLFDDRI